MLVAEPICEIWHFEMPLAINSGRFFIPKLNWSKNQICFYASPFTIHDTEKSGYVLQHTMFDDGRRKGGVVAEKLDRLEVCGFAGKSKHKGFFWDVVCVCIIASFFH